ncbi:hypothetical protein GGU10DRAFT_364970 [Lentinula aff. detonsa]|uniref:BTB domain-containing protein n=1 Tax=Lentinula aff. detonsa TaxID=2804958 RepID=A0AA38K8H3_9AGAR|nr:hypothetical protein GGU10DRAFT_364970 [Lentinula aff. detonsa]
MMCNRGTKLGFIEGFFAAQMKKSFKVVNGRVAVLTPHFASNYLPDLHPLSASNFRSLSMAAEATPSHKLPMSKRFDSAEADMTLQSSDHVLFKVHRLNLEMYSQVFADAGGSTVGTVENEIVSLSETSEVLELMLQFVYLQPQPDLRTVEWEVMKELAEAVEKYEIYSAIGVCSQRMRECVNEHPIEVLLFSVRHKYTDMMNESAEATLELPPYTMLSCLPSNVFAAWIEYQQNHQALLAKEFTRFGPSRPHRGVSASCEFWHEHYALIAATLANSLSREGPPRSRARLRAGSAGLASVLGASASVSIATGANATSLRSRCDGHKNVLLRLPEMLERRQDVGGDKCVDCKRDLTYWISQTERDWRDSRKFSDYM